MNVVSLFKWGITLLRRLFEGPRPLILSFDLPKVMKKADVVKFLTSGPGKVKDDIGWPAATFFRRFLRKW
jgi:hypothetical protein